MYDPLDPPAPEDDPEGYANSLRRRVVAMARRYFVEHGHDELIDERSHTLGLPDRSPRVALENIATEIKNLDDWKREFSLKDID